MKDIISDKINEIRRKADNPMVVCPTCGNKASMPFRQMNKQGHIIAGCIDPFHSGHLPTMTNTSGWHNRPVAKAHRKGMLAALRS